MVRSVLEDAADIEEFLEKTAGLIDQKIEEYIPRKYEGDAVVFELNPPRYNPDLEALDKAISDPIWEFLDRGGKRWRPALFLLVLEALGGDSGSYLDFAIIPEVIHNGTLMADDVEDSSELRRGKPCTYKMFGLDIAVNVSDALFFLPMLVLMRKKVKIPQEQSNKLYAIFVQEMISLSFGQAMDIAWHRGLVSNEIAEDQYLQMCMYKTGTLARMAARMAAVLAGADEDVVQVMGRFAESIGVSFQIQDDILDIVGVEFAKGKGGQGMDISEGKRSLMVIHTLRNASPKDKSRLLTILSMHTLDEKLRREAIDIIRKYNSVEYAKEVAERLMRESLNEVNRILNPSKAKEMLVALANYLIERKM
ncbi:MAG: polyprenyl synthetase family protein [Candidatus Bathyarchaeota archaeon]|nr:polyprenyl synthetase family protein [Candidatus Bathyarchaeota archaeon]